MREISGDGGCIHPFCCQVVVGGVVKAKGVGRRVIFNLSYYYYYYYYYKDFRNNYSKDYYTTINTTIKKPTV
jgi:hypothetical protein